LNSPFPFVAPSDLNVALVQLSSSDDVQDNMSKIRQLGEVIPEGSLILLPEMWSFLVPDARGEERALFAQTYQESVRSFLSEWAKEKQCALIAGSTFECNEVDQKVVNRCLVYGPQGELLEHYDKIHLFDNEIADGLFRESRTVSRGERRVIGGFGDWRVGLSICYDLRFGALYQHYSDGGAMALSVPAAFTKRTGEAHWEILLRSRAIENQCFVWACNQCGTSPAGVSCWGHSMIVDPWGKVLVQAGDEEGVFSTSCEGKTLKRVRSVLPVLQHRRELG
jgi:nitrilase